MPTLLRKANKAPESDAMARLGLRPFISPSDGYETTTGRRCGVTSAEGTAGGEPICDRLSASTRPGAALRWISAVTIRRVTKT